MKPCPKCNCSCEDSDLICRNCGYLFSPEDAPAPAAPRQNDAPGGQTPPPYAGQTPPPYAGQTPPPYAGRAPYGAYGYPQGAGYNEVKNDGYAIASLVLGLAGTICCSFILIPSILAVIFGFISRNRIRLANGGLKGGGMALAGIILGFVGVVFFVILIARLSVYGFDPYRIMRAAQLQ